MKATKRKQNAAKTPTRMPVARRKRSSLHHDTPAKRSAGWYARLIGYLFED